MGSCYVDKAGLELRGSSDPPAPAFEVAGTTGAHSPSPAQNQIFTNTG
jgi:hypothetical protein